MKDIAIFVVAAVFLSLLLCILYFMPAEAAWIGLGADGFIIPGITEGAEHQTGFITKREGASLETFSEVGSKPHGARYAQ